jgi:hypothetical protein
MKKIIAILSLVIVIGMSSCGHQNSDKNLYPNEETYKSIEFVHMYNCSYMDSADKKNPEVLRAVIALDSLSKTEDLISEAQSHGYQVLPDTTKFENSADRIFKMRSYKDASSHNQQYKLFVEKVEKSKKHLPSSASLYNNEKLAATASLKFLKYLQEKKSNYVRVESWKGDTDSTVHGPSMGRTIPAGPITF